jgi:hypothetical protein
MTLKKISICAAALVAATIGSQLAQAAGKGGGPNLGVSGSSPGHITPPTGSHGKSENAPGEMKHDSGAANAKELAPGDQKSKKK